MGWMIFKQDPKRIGRTDITDLNECPVVVWQHKHFLKCTLVMAVIFPTVFCGLMFNDWLGGFVYGAILRVSLIFFLYAAGEEVESRIDS